MKTQRRRSVTVTVFLLAAVLILGNAAQIGAVVCTGPDGPSNVESSLCACCTTIDLHDEEYDHGLTPPSPSCSDCVDVPLRVPPPVPNTPHHSIQDNCAEIRVVASGCDGVWRINLLVQDIQMDQHWQSLSPITTVVLLT